MRPVILCAAVTALAASALAPLSTSAQPFNPGPKIKPPGSIQGSHQAADAFEDAALRAAIDSPARPAADRARDAARHPMATLEFWGLRPGMTVVDLQPGGGYWTYILAPYALASHGRYIGAGSEKARAGFTAKFADATFGPPGYAVFDKASPAFAAPGSVDLVITSREIHNWIGGGYLDKAMADAFAALRPGGVLAVEEHRADPRMQKPDAADGYVATATVIAAARKAGFTFDAASPINANPKDTKDHPFGVWTLPPSRQSSADGKAPPAPGFDRARYDAIGESDRMTLRLRKPG